MHPAVDPIDEEVGEQDEERELQVAVQRERRIRRSIVEFGVAAHLAEEKGRREDGHDRQRFQSLADFEPHLILEVFRMRESGMVEDEDI